MTTPAEHANTVREALDRLARPGLATYSEPDAVAELARLVALAERANELERERDEARAVLRRSPIQMESALAEAEEKLRLANDATHICCTVEEGWRPCPASLCEAENLLKALNDSANAAEQARADADQLRETLRMLADVSGQYMNTGRGDLDGAIDLARVALDVDCACSRDEVCDKCRPTTTTR